MNYADAKDLSLDLVNALAPFCHRIEVAGSVRRERPQVNDIDLVIEPRDQRGLLARLKQFASVQTGDAPDARNTIALMGGVQIDLFFASPARSLDMFTSAPANWGSLFLCRTGSMQHNIALASRFKAMGLHWDPYRGVFKAGEIIASETEESIYEACGLKWRPPADRATLC